MNQVSGGNGARPRVALTTGRSTDEGDFLRRRTQLTKRQVGKTADRQRLLVLGRGWPPEKVQKVVAP